MLNLPNNAESVQQQEILDSLPVLIFLERGGRITFANAEARHALGVSEQEWGQPPIEDVLWGLFAGIAEPQTVLTGGVGGSPFHATLAAKGGLMMPVEGTYSILSAERRDGIIVAQITGRERTVPKSRLMEDVLASIPEAVAIVHGAHVLYTNPAFTAMFGYTAEEVSGGNLRDFIVPETRQHENAMVQRTMEEHGRAMVETVRMTKRGELVDVAMQVAPLMVNGDNAGYVLTYRDIGERKLVEAKLQHDAMHDVLTGLANQALFQDRLSLALSRRARRRDQGCGVLFIDLDRFKAINDTLGHAAGDMLLIAVADRLRAILRPQDTAARLGGDEFGLLVENFQSSGDLEIVARRVLNQLDRPFDILDNRVQIVASVGIAMAARDNETPELLIREADLAMYRAKQMGGHRYEVFDRRAEIHVPGFNERERDFRHSLNNREFEFWYQPYFRLSTGQVEGFEALLRWRRPDGTMASMRDMESMSEDPSLSMRIGRHTFETVCRQSQQWKAALPGAALTVSVNVTARQFYSDDLPGELSDVLASTGVDPSRLMLEVSEQTVNENPDRAIAIMQRLVDCGVRIALDNFGSNLAPLNHLVRLPIEVVKLDPQLTLSIAAVGRQLALLESLVYMGKAVGVQLLGKGIETQDQLATLRRMGCDLGQGYLLSHALEPSRAQQLAAASYRGVATDA